MLKGTVTIAQGRLRLVDPHDCTDVKGERSIHEAIFDALVTRGRDLSIVPGLARSWEVSPDGRTWTFFLQEGVQFHNGERFDSEVVKFSIERMARPEMGAALGAPSVYAQYLEGVRIKIVDEYTIQLTTESPNADLLDILVDGYMLPPQAVQKMGDDFKHNPVGTGAFRFAEWVPGERVVAEANESYFRGAPNVKRVAWKLIPDSTERVQELKSGRADVISRVEPGDAEEIAAAEGIHVVKLRGTTSIIYLFNCARGPFRQAKVRQAVNFAVDKTGIINSVLHGAGYVLSGFVGPWHFGFDGEVKPYPYDPVKASELLAEAGYADGLNITMDSPTSSPAEAMQLSELIAGQLEEVGIHTDLNVTTDRAIYANKVSRKEIGDMCCFDSSPLSTYRVLREKISSRFKGAWWQGFENEQIDELIDMGNQTVDDKKREEVYRQCFRLIHDDAPWLFLYNPQNIFGVADRLGDWCPRLDGCIIPQHIPLPV